MSEEQEEQEEIEPVEEHWLPPPKTQTEKQYAGLALALYSERKNLIRENQKKVGEIQKLRGEIEQVRTDTKLEHIEYVALGDQVGQMAEEMEAAQKREVSLDKRLTSRLQTELAYTHAIDDLIQGKNPRNWLKFGWEFVALFLIFLVAFWAPFRELVFANLTVIVVGGCILAYLAWRVNKGKKK
jgi:hypothetical protein